MTDKLKLESQEFLILPDKVEQKPKSIRNVMKRGHFILLSAVIHKDTREDTEFTKDTLWMYILLRN